MASGTPTVTYTGFRPRGAAAGSGDWDHSGTPRPHWGQGSMYHLSLLLNTSTDSLPSAAGPLWFYSKLPHATRDRYSFSFHIKGFKGIVPGYIELPSYLKDNIYGRNVWMED